MNVIYFPEVAFCNFRQINTFENLSVQGTGMPGVGFSWTHLQDSQVQMDTWTAWPEVGHGHCGCSAFSGHAWPNKTQPLRPRTLQWGTLLLALLAAYGPRISFYWSGAWSSEGHFPTGIVQRINTSMVSTFTGRFVLWVSNLGTSFKSGLESST